MPPDKAVDWSPKAKKTCEISGIIMSERPLWKWLTGCCAKYQSSQRVSAAIRRQGVNMRRISRSAKAFCPSLHGLFPHISREGGSRASSPRGARLPHSSEGRILATTHFQPRPHFRYNKIASDRILAYRRHLYTHILSPSRRIRHRSDGGGRRIRREGERCGCRGAFGMRECDRMQSYS